VDFAWSLAKNKRNVARHGLSLADAEVIFSAEYFEVADDRFDYGEKRRLISARPATTAESKEYYEIKYGKNH